MNNREPPANLFAERALLGALLVENKAIDGCVGLTGGDFYWPSHGMLFDAIKKRIEAGRPVDPVIIKDTAAVIFEAEGGVSYLMQLCSAVLGTKMVPEYAHTIMDCALRRSTIEIAQAAIDAAHGDEPGLAVSTRAIAALEQATSRYALNKPMTMGSAVAQAVARAEAAKKGEAGASPLITGIRSLDALWRGIHPGALEIIGGRPGCGKTSLVRQISRHIGAQFPVAFFSLEMSAEDIGIVELASVSGVPADAIRNGEFSTNQASSIILAQKNLSKLDVHIVDKPVTITEATSKMRGMVNLLGVKLIIVDHRDKFVQTEDMKNDLSRYTDVSRLLKETAKYLNIPIILLVHLSKEIERRGDGRPKMSDIMYGSEADGDNILLMHKDSNATEISFVKRRFGSIGTVRLRFDGARQSFYDLDDQWNR